MKVSIFLAPMLNFPMIFEFGPNIQKFFDKFLEISSKITQFIWNQICCRSIYRQNYRTLFEIAPSNQKHRKFIEFSSLLV